MLVPLLLLAIPSPRLVADALPDPSKGASLLRGCQAQVRLMSLPALDDAPPIDLINGAYCIGYVNGFLAALPVAPSAICTKQANMGALVKAYVQYMETNPRLQNEDKRVGLRLALQTAYPCSGSTF